MEKLQQDAGIHSCWSKDGKHTPEPPLQASVSGVSISPHRFLSPFLCLCSSEQCSVAHTHHTQPHSSLFEAQLPRLYHGQNEITWIVSL